jgi:hypothetical protein
MLKSTPISFHTYYLLYFATFFFLSFYGYMTLFIDISRYMYQWMLSFHIYISVCLHIYILVLGTLFHHVAQGPHER